MTGVRGGLAPKPARDALVSLLLIRKPFQNYDQINLGGDFGIQLTQIVALSIRMQPVLGKMPDL